MRSIEHFIGGREVKGTSGRTAGVFEPMTGDVQAQVTLASKAELRAAVENAKAAQVEWGKTNPQRPRDCCKPGPRCEVQAWIAKLRGCRYVRQQRGSSVSGRSAVRLFYWAILILPARATALQRSKVSPTQCRRALPRIQRRGKHDDDALEDDLQLDRQSQ